jgi:hypothetical protein
MDVEESVVPGDEEAVPDVAYDSTSDTIASPRAQIAKKLSRTVEKLKRRIRYLELERTTTVEVDPTINPPCSPSVISGRKDASSENTLVSRRRERVYAGQFGLVKIMG